MSVPFISEVDLQDYLGGTLDSGKAAIALDAACDTLRKSSGQQLDFVQDDEVLLDSDGSDTILLPELPVWEVASVEHAGSILTVDSDYVFDFELGAIRTKNLSSRFLAGRQTYTVIYSHGYTSELVEGMPDGVELWPSALRILALQVAARIYDQGLVKQESVGGYAATYSVDEAEVLSTREKSMLERIVGVGRRR